MLSLDHKATLLRKAGFPVPVAPRACAPRPDLGREGVDGGTATGTPAAGEACTQWEQRVDALFVAHSIARALRALQQEELRLRDAVAHYLPPLQRPDVYGVEDR